MTLEDETVFARDVFGKHLDFSTFLPIMFWYVALPPSEFLDVRLLMAKIAENGEFTCHHEGGFDRLLSASDTTQLVGLTHGENLEFHLEASGYFHFCNTLCYLLHIQALPSGPRRRLLTALAYSSSCFRFACPRCDSFWRWLPALCCMCIGRWFNSQRQMLLLD